MKKLMFVLAAVVALGAQAASLDWSIATKSITAQEASPAYNFQKTVYLLDTSASDYATLTAALSGGTLEGGVAAFNPASWSAVVGSAQTYSNSKTSKQSKSYGGVSSAVATVADANVGVEKYYAILAFDMKGGEDYYVLSSTVAGVAYESDPNDGQAVAFAGPHFGAWTKYTTSDVPEPTSGLLLALGASLLALRRRRA